jgi:general secretion pathway protein D
VRERVQPRERASRVAARSALSGLQFTLLALLLVTSGCLSQDETKDVAPASGAGTTSTVPLPAPPATPSGVASFPPVSQTGLAATPTRRGEEVVVPGTGSLLAPPGAVPPRSARVSPEKDGAVSFSFVNADVREVAREILGNQLRLGYVVDPTAQAQITAQTGAPVPRDEVLPTLESILSANGLAMLEADGVWRILPMQSAARASLGTPVAAQPGYAIRVLPLKFVSAAELKGVLDPFVPPGGALQVGGARNVLLVTAPAADLDGLADLVRRFDVDWLAGTSFALYPLRVAMAKDVASDLEAIFGDGTSGPLAGQVRIVPIERLNAILVISAQRQYLSEAKTWIGRFDYGEDQMTPRMFEYRVQNSRAADLAAVLTQLLSSGAVGTVQPVTAPGARSTTIGQPGGGFGMPGATPGLPSGGRPGLVPGMTTRAASETAAAAAPAGTTPGYAGETFPGTRESEKGFGAPAETLHPTARGAEAGATELSLPSVRVVADEKNNAVVVYARPRDYRMVEDIIQRLDVVPLQVLIEATIAEVRLNDALQYGLQWFFSQASSKFELTAAKSGLGTAADVNPVFPGFNYVLGGNRGKLVLSALSDITHVDVVSAPQLLVLDHQTASLQVGDQVPIISATAVSTLVTGAPIVNSVQYLNTGVLLMVTPRVNTSGLITLDIDQSVSDVSKTTTSNIDSPTITQRRITTSVTVQDGQTIALGGLILDNRNVGRQGIPILSDIPIFGALFSQRSKTAARTELLVLLTPRILRDAKEARQATDELRERMRAVKPLELRAR